jgi:hypothetical protein
MPNSALDKETFALYTVEHQRYLDAKFTSVCNKVDAIVEIRKEDIVDCGKCKTEINKKFKNTHKYMVVGIAVVAILAGVQIPAVQAAAVALIKLFF